MSSGCTNIDRGEGGTNVCIFALICVNFSPPINIIYEDLIPPHISPPFLPML